MSAKKRESTISFDAHADDAADALAEKLGSRSAAVRRSLAYCLELVDREGIGPLCTCGPYTSFPGDGRIGNEPPGAGSREDATDRMDGRAPSLGDLSDGSGEVGDAKGVGSSEGGDAPTRKSRGDDSNGEGRYIFGGLLAEPEEEEE